MAYYIILSILIISFLILANYVVCTVIYRKERPLDFGALPDFPKVSVLKPLKNTDDELEKNLEHFFTLEYPAYEIIFGVDTLDDACVPMLKRHSASYPGIPVKIVAVGKGKILNPKIETLSLMARESEGALYWISDSNTRVESDTLSRLVHEHRGGDSKLVFSLIRGTGSRTAGSVMENAYLNLFVAGSIVCAWKYAAKPIVMGKSMLLEKAALEKLGGFDAFRQYLAEDYMMGQIYGEKGLKVSTNCNWITNFSSHTNIRAFCARISRWSKMRYHISPLYYSLEVILNPIGIALFSLLFLGKGGLPLLAAAVVFKVACEYASLFAVNAEDRKKPWVLLGFPALMVLKDLLLFAVYFLPFFSSTVNWRGRDIRIGSKSRIYA
ncbi:MAG: glycosyltransferase [Endomicrobiales bacterium]